MAGYRIYGGRVYRHVHGFSLSPRLCLAGDVLKILAKAYCPHCKFQQASQAIEYLDKK
jgi:hypothetical protein